MSRTFGDNQDDTRPLILIVDRDAELLAMLSESMSASYRTMISQDGDAAMNLLRYNEPDLIIADSTARSASGASLVRLLKDNRHTKHIPLIILSEKTSVKDQVQGLMSGGDAYLGKPFDVSYLQAVVYRFLDRDAFLKEYFTSSASSFEYMDGKLLAAEDREFLLKVTTWVKDSIGKNVGAAQMADYLNISTRKMYRKFKSLGLLPPNSFINEHRMLRAEHLLKTTDTTVQEIIYECGFSSRARFYSEFEKRHGMTPRAFRNIHRSAEGS
ncbi:MAG: DNA-binding response regulator [Bacteroidales bacterium]|nr:DNA-binding response regulator [Bacteroidales bacterium]